MNPRRLSQRWMELTQLGVALLSAFSGLLLAPPRFLDSGTRLWPAHVALSMTSGLLLVAARRWHRGCDTRRWAGAAMGALGAALVSALVHRLLVDAWTCRYYGSIRVVGSELTPHAADYLREASLRTCEELLKVFTGRRAEIWTRASLVRNELLLLLSYVCIVPLLAASAIATLQALCCSRDADRRSLPIRRQLLKTHPRKALALTLSRLVLSHETILRHAQTALRAPELLQIPGSASALDLWLAVLQRAEMEAAVPALVASVLDENPAADALKAALEDWREKEPSRALQRSAVV